MIHRPIIAVALGMILAASGVGRADLPNHPTKIWNRTGPLGKTPKHVTDAYPLGER